MTLTAIFGFSRSVRASLPAGDIGAAATQTRAAQPPMPLPGALPENNGAISIFQMPNGECGKSTSGQLHDEPSEGVRGDAARLGGRSASPGPVALPSDRELCRDNLRLFERLAARDGAARWQVSIDHWAAAVADYEWRAVDFGYGDDDGMAAWLNRSGGLEFLQWPGDGGAWLRPEAAAPRLGVTAERLQELVWWADSEAAAGV